MYEVRLFSEPSRNRDLSVMHYIKLTVIMGNLSDKHVARLTACKQQNDCIPLYNLRLIR